MAENLNVGLGVPAQCVSVDDGGEPADDPAVEQAVDTPLHRRSGQAHPLADFGVRRPGILRQLGENSLVRLIQSFHACLHAINRRAYDSDTMNHW